MRASARMIGGVSALLLLAAEAAHAQEKVALGTLPVSANPSWVALDQKFFKNEGLDVNIQTFQSGATAMEALLSGSVNFAFFGFGPTVFAAARDLPIVAIVDGPYSNKDAALDAIIVRSDSPYRSMKDLDGKIIAVQTKGTIEHLLVEIYAKKYNVDVKLVEIPFTQQELALQHGDIDAVCTATPTLEQMLLVGDRAIHSIPGDLIPYYQVAQVVTTRDYAAKNQQIVLAMTRAMIRTFRWISDNPVLARDITVGKYLHYSDDLKDHVRLAKWSKNGLPMLPSLRYFAEKMKGVGLIKEVPRVEKYYVTDYVRQVTAEIGEVPDPEFDATVATPFPKD
jgi:NitT/TauT family transport system substrate-binding protein